MEQTARRIGRFGLTDRVLVSDVGEIIAGHGRVRAAALLGMASILTIALSHLFDAGRRADVVADNKPAMNAGWNNEVLAIKLHGLIDLDFDTTLKGFNLAETDFSINAARKASLSASVRPDDQIPVLPDWPVTKRRPVAARSRQAQCGDERDPLSPLGSSRGYMTHRGHCYCSQPPRQYPGIAPERA